MTGKLENSAIDEILRRLRGEHLSGSPTAARTALSICATRSVVMPKWLAKVVNESIAQSDSGEADNPLGFGNPKMITVWKREHRKRRNEGWLQDFKRLSEMLHGKMKKSEIKEMLSDISNRSQKTAEKSIHPPRR